MQALRHASFLARLVLAWFVLSLGVAVASPIVKPVDLQLVCSGATVKLVAAGDEGTPAAGHSLECPLCVMVGAPPPPASAPAVNTQPLAHAVAAIPSARIAALTAAPLPARGPPTA